MHGAPPARDAHQDANQSADPSVRCSGPSSTAAAAGLMRVYTHSNLLVRGKPFGASRPASARLPRQSASSLSDSLNRRAAESVQVNPTSALNALRSDSPPSL